MYYRKKCHSNPYRNTGVTVTKLIKYTLTTYTIRTERKTVFRISALQKNLLHLLFLNFSAVVAPTGSHQIECLLW